MANLVVIVVYIFQHFNQYISKEFNKNINEEERSSRTTRTGVSQKDLQISKKQKKKKNAKKLVEKGRAHCKFAGGQ